MRGVHRRNGASSPGLITWYTPGVVGVNSTEHVSFPKSHLGTVLSLHLVNFGLKLARIPALFTIFELRMSLLLYWYLSTHMIQGRNRESTMPSSEVLKGMPLDTRLPPLQVPAVMLSRLPVLLPGEEIRGKRGEGLREELGHRCVSRIDKSSKYRPRAANLVIHEDVVRVCQALPAAYSVAVCVPLIAVEDEAALVGLPLGKPPRGKLWRIYARSELACLPKIGRGGRMKGGRAVLNIAWMSVRRPSDVATGGHQSKQGPEAEIPWQHKSA